MGCCLSMCAMNGGGQDLLSCLKWVCEQLINLRFPQDGVRSLTIASTNLESRREVVQGKIDKPGQICSTEETAWIENVETCAQEVAKIREAICCVQCFLINTSSELLTEINRLLDQEKGFEAVAFNQVSGAIRGVPIPSNLFWLESYLEKVDRYLADDEVHVVGIWGMAGVGKTMLLQTIRNQLRPGGRLSQGNTFRNVLLLEACKDDKQGKLQEIITTVLGCGLQRDRNLKTIKKSLRRNLLLLLDDLWEFVDLEKMGIPIHSHSGSPKYKVIFTTRSKEVHHKMRADRDMKMECLDARNARLLFERSIDQEVVRKPALRNLMKNVIDVCHGLPIALATVAQAMALKTDRDDWERANALGQQSRVDEILDEGDRQTFEENLYKRLKISYDRLSDDTTRECFLSCALWPKGCTIEKLELILSWMGLGLLDRSMNHDFNKAYDEGNKVIEKLKAACLLEADLTNKNKADLTSKNKVKMHGVFRDMALWIANEKGANIWIVKEDGGFVRVLDHPGCWKAAQRISLMYHRLTELPPNLDCPRLSSLMLQKNPGLTRIPRDFFQFMVALSFLDLSFTGLCELPEEIGSLTQLHYLNLSNTPISSLPSTLKNLKGLKYLLLNNTRNLREIQYGLISSLSMLLVLDLFGCGYADWELDEPCSGASLGEFHKLKQGLKFLGITIRTSRALVQLSAIPL